MARALSSSTAAFSRAIGDEEKPRDTEMPLDLDIKSQSGGL